jgi:hypothetical protein
MEDEILTDFVAFIGAIGVMVGAESTKTGRLKPAHRYERYPGVSGRTHLGRCGCNKNQSGRTMYVNVLQMIIQYLSL